MQKQTQSSSLLNDSLLDYQPASEGIDEAIAPDGQVNSSWQYLLNGLSKLGSQELSQRQQKALRILRDDGATYNRYDRQASDSTWLLDLVPFLIDSAQWSEIESGLQERAELFNLILKDIYGERELISRGIIPGELIFGHKSFLRSCQGIKLPGEHQLIVHAADMIRQADGSLCLLADRTQAPSGAGYALENRTVMNRVLPSLFRDSHVHRLANYFQILRQTLINLAPNKASPRIVVLTPGSFNEAYFEHSYLADYLGFSLVQSGDLIVKGGYVWLKSLDGLSRVDVILRRVDDYFCDPVELKGDSKLGIPGLLEVARNGNVAIANPLGSGILENPALLRFLPKISQHFLGRELRLGSVKTWWCGLEEDRNYVLNHLDEMVIKTVFRTPGINSIVVSQASAEQRQKLIHNITSKPSLYVAQVKLAPSHTPSLHNNQLSPRPALLRTYSVAYETSYRVMPGGLTRIGAEENSSLISSQLGSISKDTWVLASEPEKQTPLWPKQPDEDLITEDALLPSRVVENLFWLGRYAERAENTLRLVRTTLLQTDANQTNTPARQHLLNAVTQATATYPGFIGQPQLYNDPESELLNLVLDVKRSGSVRQSVQALLNCAEECKGLMSSDGQRVINDIRDQLSSMEQAHQSRQLSAPAEALNPIITSLLALSHSVQDTMIRDTGWRFIDMGHRLERSIQAISLIRSTLQDKLNPYDEAQALEAVLMTMENLISYRRRYQGSFNVRNALELLLLDTANPCSLLFQLNTLNNHFANLPLEANNKELSPEQRCLAEALNLLHLSSLNDLTQSDSDTGQRMNLSQLLNRLLALLAEASNLLSKRFFDQSDNPQQLVDQNWNNE